MRIERLQVDGFGHFFKHPVGPLDAPLTVLYGSNEAGKSTLLAFVRTMLFGFPASKQAQFYPPLNGGAHGGRITLVGNDSRQYIVERHAGPKGGTCSVTAGGQPVDDAATLGSLLGHASEVMYRAVFAFGLDELQTLKSLNQADVGGLIYSAGMGAARLPAALGSIDKRSDAIFKSGGSNQDVAKILNALNDVQSKLDAVKGQAGEYGRLTARLEEIARELESVRGSAAKLNAVIALIASLGQKLAQLAEAEEDRIRLAEKVREPLRDRALLDDAEAIRRIQEGRGSFANSVRDLPERQAELRGFEDGLSEVLRDLGQGWDEVRLDSFDTSVPVRDAVGQWRKRLEDGDRSAHDARARVDNAAGSVKGATERRDEARRDLDALPPSERDRPADAQARADLRAARTSLGEYSLARRHREDLEQQAGGVAAGPALPLWPVALVAAITLAAVGAVIGGDALALGIVGGVMLAAGAAYLYLRDRLGGGAGGTLAGVLSGQLDAARAKEREEAGALAAIATRLDLPDPRPTPEKLDTFEAGLDVDLDRLRVREDAEARLREVEKELKRARRDLEEAETLRDAAETEFRDARAGWQQWLAGKDLPGDLLPETVQDILSRVEAARAKRGGVVAMRNRIAAILDDIREHGNLVTPLARRHGIAVEDGSDHSVMSAAGELVERYEKARVADVHRRQNEETLKEAEAAVERRRNEVDDLRADLRELFAPTAASDFEELKRHHDVLDVAEVDSPELLATKAVAVKQDVDEIESRQGELQTERGTVVQQLQSLAGDEETSRLRVERSVLVEQLRAKAREWAALALARALLEKTRAKFEAERQPDVIKHAQGFFETVTGGRYRRLVSPLGSQTVKVEQQDGRPKSPDQLSRGTQEQLYLALRFGLIREFGERATRLPVVVDEVLVNFDPDRARRAAEAFAELARTNQVLVFTCHPETAEVFKDVCPDARIIEIAAPDLFTSGAP